MHYLDVRKKRSRNEFEEDKDRELEQNHEEDWRYNPMSKGKDVQKKDTNNRPSETRNRRNKRKKTINKTSYFLSNSLNKSLNQMLELKISPKNRERKRTIRKLFYEKLIPFKQ